MKAHEFIEKILVTKFRAELREIIFNKTKNNFYSVPPRNVREIKKILKRTHKSLFWIEACYIYCKRHNIDYDTFIDNDLFLSDDFDCSENSEFDRICKDLRCYRYFESHKLIEITDDEYDMCVDKFGSIERK